MLIDLNLRMFDWLVRGLHINDDVPAVDAQARGAGGARPETDGQRIFSLFDSNVRIENRASVDEEKGLLTDWLRP